MMFVDSLDMYSRCLARKITGTAYRTRVSTRDKADAGILVDQRTQVAPRLGDRNHGYGSGRTSARAVAARLAVGGRDTTVEIHGGGANLSGAFHSHINRFDSSGRAHIAAGSTFWSAPAAVERHYRLHQRIDVVRRTQHAVGTIGYT